MMENIFKISFEKTSGVSDKTLAKILTNRLQRHTSGLDKLTRGIFGSKRKPKITQKDIKEAKIDEFNKFFYNTHREPSQLKKRELARNAHKNLIETYQIFYPKGQ